MATEIEKLPAPDLLRESMLKMAALEIVLNDEDYLRYHRFHKDWSEGVQLAEVDNGSGDTMHILFSEAGTVIKGFDHESPLSPHAQDVYAVREGMYDGLPEALSVLLDDVALQRDDVTFCFWREKNDTAWKQGPVKFGEDENDGSGFLLETIELTAESFKDWADDYYETELPLDVLRKFYETGKLTEEMILALNSECDMEQVKEELKALGF